MPPETSITKRVEPSIHSSSLDSFRIVNKPTPKSEEEAEAQAAERRGEPRARPAQDNSQPIRTQARTVTIGQRAPISVTMGGSGAVVVHRPPPAGPGDVPKQPYATGPIAAQPVIVMPALSAEQVALCVTLIADRLDTLRPDEAGVELAKSTLAALKAIR